MKNKTNYSSIDEIKEVFKGKKILITMFIGEIGWELQRFQAHLRFLKNKEFPDWDFVVMCRPHMHIFYDDFVSYTLELPEWFNELNLEGDGYEAVLPGTPAGGLTPPEVYQNLVHLLNSFGEGVEDFNLLLPPRGCSMFIEHSPQFFRKFTSEECLSGDRAIITVLPRARARAPQRNVPEFIWREVVTELSKTFTVVLAGTPSGACLSDMEGPHIINLIKYNEKDKTEQIIKYLNNSVCSVSSQSGGTHISLLCGTPSYIIGHEMDRHANIENRLQAPTSFRILTDYRAIDAQTILTDLQTFIQSLFKANWFSKVNRPSLKFLESEKDLIGVEIGTDNGLNALNILENLNIKTLYLVDPYTMYRDLEGIGCNHSEEQCKEIRNTAHERLKDYKDKIVWIEDLSENAVDKIPDFLDFVYVDGNHRYEYVVKDIGLYFPKLRAGGIMGFHDYDYEGVRLAVEKMFPDGIGGVDLCKDNNDRQEAWVLRSTFLDRPSLNTLIKKRDLVGVEIGVGLGINAVNMLSTLDIKKLYLIDPYIMTKDKGVAGIKVIDGIEVTDKSKELLKDASYKIKAIAINKLKPFEDKIEWIFDYSEFAAKLIPDDLDFVYIDGNHDYEGVKKDIELYHEKVKQGGLVAGHDYDGADVEKAVKEFYKDTKVNLGENSDWWVVKEQNIDEFDIIGQDYNKLLELV